MYLSNIKYLLIYFTLVITIFGNDIEKPEESCFTAYPNVLIRKTPSQTGEVVRKIENVSRVAIKSKSSNLERIQIRGQIVSSNWLKVDDGWIFGGLVKCIPKITFAFPILYHNDQLPFKPTNIKDWASITAYDGMYHRNLMSILLKREHDSIVDQSKETRTGYKIHANKSILLIKGIKVTEGSFPIIDRKIPYELEFGKSYTFKNGKDKYVLKSIGKYNNQILYNYKLILRKNDQEIVLDDRKSRFEKPILTFIGDIDGDGELDFLIDLRDHYNVSDGHLFISSEKINDFFVVPVASHWTTGC